jgi:hypothetical protein
MHFEYFLIIFLQELIYFSYKESLGRTIGIFVRFLHRMVVLYAV